MPTTTELGVVMLAPALDGYAGTRGDLANLRNLAAAGVRLSPIYDRTTELVRRSVFHRRVLALELTLYSRPIMSGDEVALLLGD